LSFGVSASDLNNVRFRGGSVAGNDNVRIWAHDGQVWGWKDISIATKQTNKPPIVSASNQSVNVNQTLKPAFSVNDPDSDTITRYHFHDNTSSSTSGYFERFINGQWVKQSLSFGVSASDLNSVRFRGGSVAGNDNVRIWAYDGQAWGWKDISIETTQPNRSPIVSASNQSVNVNQTLKPAFSVNDPDSDTITRYHFHDNTSSSTSGYFERFINGQWVKQSLSFGVSASDLNSVRFRGGSVAGNDNVRIWAYDGQAWGWKDISIETTQPNRSPIVSASNQSVNVNQTLKPVFSVNDPDGDSITRYWFHDNTSSSTSGYFERFINGQWVKQSLSFGVSASDLNNVRFRGGSVAGNDNVRIWAYDGQAWGWKDISIETKGTTTTPKFTNFSVKDASGDSTTKSVFQGGAIRLNYGLANTANLSSVRLEAIKSGSVINLGSWSGSSASNKLIDLAGVSSFIGGDYQLRAVARTTSGQEIFSNSTSMKVLSNSTTSWKTGTFAAETLSYTGGNGSGGVIIGRGGTDTLNLSGIRRSDVTSINGISLNSFNPWSSSTTSQAIFKRQCV
jgi:hypothetical protein